MKKSLLIGLILTTAMLSGLPTGGWAMLAPADGGTRTADLNTARTALEAKEVRERLHRFGLTDAEIDTRLSKLSDQQLRTLAGDIRTLSPGGERVSFSRDTLLIVLLIVVILIII